MNREAWWVIYSPWGREEWDINHHHHHGFGSCCQSTPCPPSSPGTLDPGWHYFLPSPSSVGLILPPASHLSGYSVLLMLWLVGTYVSSFPRQNRFHPDEMKPSTTFLLPALPAPGEFSTIPHPMSSALSHKSISDLNALKC